MKFDIVTCVWGSWHCEALSKVMLPTLLAPGNLPAVSSCGSVRYRIFTTSHDRLLLESLPIMKKLRELVAVEIIAGSEERNPTPVHHIRWYHQASDEARENQAFVVFAPPDVAWSDGTFAHMAAVMRTGLKGCAMPYLRVVSETCLPEIARYSGGNQAAPIVLPPTETMRLGLRHLHPLSAAVLDGSPHSRPSLEMLWPVAGEGLVLRHVVRELFAFDPERCRPTEFWYAGAGVEPSEIHIVTDSNDMMMLSLAPLIKDIGDIGIYIPNHSPQPIDIARSSLHPLNDTPLNVEFSRKSIRLHVLPTMTEHLWRAAERRSDRVFRQVIVQREAMRIWAVLHEKGCSIAGRVLALALQATPLARRWRQGGPLAVFAPDDAAFETLGQEALGRLLEVGAEWRLIRFIMAHVMPRAEALNMTPANLRPHSGTEVAPHIVYVVDRVLDPDEQYSSPG